MEIKPSEEDRKNAEIRVLTDERFCDIDKLVFSRNETFWMMVNKQAKLIACERIIGEMETRLKSYDEAMQKEMEQYVHDCGIEPAEEVSSKWFILRIAWHRARISELEEQLKGKSK